MPDNTLTDSQPAWRLTTSEFAGIQATTAIDAQGGFLGCIFPSADPERGWCLAVPGLPTVNAYCGDQADALAWLQHLASLATRQVTA